MTGCCVLARHFRRFAPTGTKLFSIHFFVPAAIFCLETRTTYTTTIQFIRHRRPHKLLTRPPPPPPRPPKLSRTTHTAHRPLKPTVGLLDRAPTDNSPLLNLPRASSQQAPREGSLGSPAPTARSLGQKEKARPISNRVLAISFGGGLDRFPATQQGITHFCSRRSY